MVSCDVAIIGGGIIGASAAAYLAEAGRSVCLFEQAQIAAGASGRNSGAVQHPFDPVFVDLYRKSLALYRDPLLAEGGFELPDRPAGLLLVSFDEAAVAADAADLEAQWPELAPTVLAAGAAALLEPALHPRLAACRTESAYPVAPAAATLAFASRARRAGAMLRTATEATVAISVDRVTGVRLPGGESVSCEQVLVAAGPWSPSLVPGWSSQPPVRSVWGVVVSTSLAEAPRHVLEELGIDRPGAPLDRLFSMVTAAGATSVGSTFLPEEPDPHVLADEIVERGQAFVPSLRGATRNSVRACARPVSVDGRPLIGAVGDIDGLFVCAGHGPWGISTGPASAALVARQMLGTDAEHPEFSPARFQGLSGSNSEFA